MARKTLDSNPKRKAEIEHVDLTGDEVLSSLTSKKKKIDANGSNKSPKSAKKPDDSKKNVTTSKKTGDSGRKVDVTKKNAKTSNKTGDSSRKVDESKKKEKAGKIPEKKVKFETPVKMSGKKKEVEGKKEKKSKVEKEEVVDEDGNGALYAFPMNRVTRIVKSESSDVKLSAEAAFLFNKASEKFLELFSKEAYSCASKDGKKKIEYEHLSSLVPESKRFDFLADFVPAKVKVSDALKETQS